MTEVVGMLETHQFTSPKLYTSTSTSSPSPTGHELVDADTYATTKEEEWVSKKKTEIVNTKQIETRVKRQVVLEDGKVVEDTGPMVTTNTTEDTETKENHQTEHRKLGNGDTNNLNSLEDDSLDKSNWISVPNPDGVVREVKERRVVSREETEDVKETEEVQHLGDITEKEFLSAIKSGESDLRNVLKTSDGGKTIISTGPRLIRDTTKTKKVTDTEETKESSSVRPDGKIVTETQRTTEHEEFNDDEYPEDAIEQNYEKSGSQRYVKTRDQEDVDYYQDGRNIGHEMKYKTETMEVEKRGEGVDEPDLFESLSARVKRRGSKQQAQKYRGITEWNERRYNTRTDSPYLPSDSPKPYVTSPSPSYQEYSRKSPVPDYRTPTFNDSLGRRSPIPDYRHRESPVNFEGSLRKSPRDEYARPLKSPAPDYFHHSPSPDYGRPLKKSPPREPSPQPPQRIKKEKHRQKVVEERSRYDSGYRSRQEDSRDERDDRMEEPPIDYSPPSPPPMPKEDKKPAQRTRFAKEPPSRKTKSGNIIGQSFRKLVNKIRSASAERKQKNQRVKRSPSPSYQQGHVIDYNNGGMERQPVHRYYLGEDPFGGSIFGREDKYDGVKPARSSRKRPEEDRRTHGSSTLGRLSKSTSRLTNQRGGDVDRSSQTLPRRLNKYDPPTKLEKSGKSSSTINVSSVNNSSLRFANDGPPKPSRTYKSNLARSKSLIVQGDQSPTRRNMYTSNPHINRIDEHPTGLKSPGLISSLSRTKLNDLNEDVYVPRFYRNGDTVDHSTTRRYSPPTFETRRYSPASSDNKRYSPPSSDSKRPVMFEKSENKIPGGFERSEKRIYIHSAKDRPSDVFKNSLIRENGDDSWRPKNFSTPIGKSSRHFNGDIYEPPIRLRDNHIISTSTQPTSILRRGSNSSTDFSETYRTTTRNDDPIRPSITNTVKTVSKKTLPSKNGRAFETIESSEMQSVTKSQFKESRPSSALKFYENERRYSTSRDSNGSSRAIPIEVEHYRSK